jgi:long-chain acyl-CoA synthetase
MNTRDLGLLDKEGNIFIKGRSKNMILTPNGQNIYPEEVEAVINNQPYIVESIVVSRGAALVGLVYMDSEKIAQEGINTEEYRKCLIKEVNAQMPAYSKISAIEIAETPFEKTPKMSIKRFLYS